MPCRPAPVEAEVGDRGPGRFGQTTPEPVAWTVFGEMIRREPSGNSRNVASAEFSQKCTSFEAVSSAMGPLMWDAWLIGST